MDGQTPNGFIFPPSIQKPCGLVYYPINKSVLAIHTNQIDWQRSNGEMKQRTRM
jgi:hypothetical protein